MPWVAAAIGGSALVGAWSSSKAAQGQADAATQAAEAQSAAARYAADLQQKQYEENVARQQPFYQAGVNALPALVQASNYKPFGMDQFNADPGYAFRLSEGQKALDRSAAARGGLISGGALKAAATYGQNMGSQEYQNAFNRYQTERQATLSPLQALTGMGGTTASNLGAAGQTNATNIGNLGMAGAAATAEGYMGSANARASGYMGTANALTSALGTGLNYYNQSNLLSALKGGGAGASGAGYYNANNALNSGTNMYTP
jgi:hypothetical protein